MDRKNGAGILSPSSSGALSSPAQARARGAAHLGLAGTARDQVGPHQEAPARPVRRRPWTYGGALSKVISHLMQETGKGPKVSSHPSKSNGFGGQISRPRSATSLT